MNKFFCLSTARNAASLSKQQQTGFSLIEVLVGLGIGMVGMVVMLQVFSVFRGL